VLWRGQIKEMEEAIEIVNPIVEVDFIIFLVSEVAWLGQPPRQSIRSVDLTGDVAEL